MTASTTADAYPPGSMQRATLVLGSALTLCLVAASCGDDGGSGVTTTGSVPALTTVTDAAWDTSTVATTIVDTSAASTTTGGSATSSPCVLEPTTATTVGQPPTGTSVVITQPPTGTTMLGGVALRSEGNVYEIDWRALVGPVIFAPPGSGTDPFYLVYNSPEYDGFSFSVEAHTACGTQWSGQLGTFAIGCSTVGTGICVHFDPDGSGPMPDLGADFMVSGTIEIFRADDVNFIAELSDLTFSDGSTIPGPFMISG